MNLLEKISKENNIKNLTISELELLSTELREFVQNSVLESGGHFSSNLGVIELTVALHHLLNLPHDAIIWDVGHQSYPHKVLTDRKNDLHHIRNFKGISGFPKRDEHPSDVFGTGHSSTAISAAMGMAAAQKILGKSNTFVAVVGDGALTAGLSYEALNNLFESNLNVLIVLNDNHMGIDPNTGALNTQLQTHTNQIKQWFEWFGLTYSGPVDGHKLTELLPALLKAYNTNGPRLLHVKTIKGKGYPPAEQEQTKWHSASKFVKIEAPSKPAKKWQDAFGEILLHLAKANPNLTGITPAMPSSCGMIHAMNHFPDRFFDVGIAEQHALTFAAGMATQGMIPVVNIYSSFLQRGYDQLIHDIVLQKLPVIICIDRAGLVGEDGPTHHGAFDIAFLGCLPNLILVAPKNAQELAAAMQWGINIKKPIAIRYPKGNLTETNWEQNQFDNPESHLQPQFLQHVNNAKILLLTTGHASNLAQQAHHQLEGIQYHHIHYPMISENPVTAQIQSGQNNSTSNISWTQYEQIITVEDGCIQGGWGQKMASALSNITHSSFIHLGIPNEFIEHGNNEEDLYPLCGYSPGQIAQSVLNAAAKNSH